MRMERFKRGMTRKPLASTQPRRSAIWRRSNSATPIRACSCSIPSRARSAPTCSISCRLSAPEEARRRAFAHLRQLPASEVRNWLQMFSRNVRTVPAAHRHEPTRQAPRADRTARRRQIDARRDAGTAARLPVRRARQDRRGEHGASVATLFDVYGQATFRRYERDALSARGSDEWRRGHRDGRRHRRRRADARAAARPDLRDLAEGHARRAHAPRDGAGRPSSDGAQSATP